MELGTLLRILNEGKNDPKSCYSVILVPGAGGRDTRHTVSGASGEGGDLGYRDGGARTRTLLIEPVVATADDYVFAATLGREPEPETRVAPLSAPLTPLALDELRRPRDELRVLLRDAHGALTDSSGVRRRVADDVYLYDRDESRNVDDRSLARQRRSPSSVRDDDVTATAVVANVDETATMDIDERLASRIEENEIERRMERKKDDEKEEETTAATTTTTTTEATDEEWQSPPYAAFECEPTRDVDPTTTSSLSRNDRGLVGDMFRALTTVDGGVATTTLDYDVDGKPL